jgi:hypothetical protein
MLLHLGEVANLAAGEYREIHVRLPAATLAAPL